MKHKFENKIVLVTGGTGWIGSELVKKILAFNPKQVRVYSRDEHKQFYLQKKLGNPENLRLFLGDIRDKDRLRRAFDGVDIVFHAAALKHVAICEYNPFEVVKTNIMGTQNVIDVAIEHNVEKLVAISSDKSVNPTSIMGVSKLMMEKLVVNANYYSGNAQTKFSCVRFGNVMWSRGSVLPIWKEQVEENNNITITNSEMTRFFMHTNEAIDLVLTSAVLAKGGEIFVLKMKSIELGELARAFIDKFFPDSGVTITKIGLFPGEKMHEDLFTESELSQTLIENKKLYVLLPEILIDNVQSFNTEYEGFNNVICDFSYSSQNFLDTQSIKAVL